MTPNEQLEMWISGNSVHNPDRDECCPDFSCCKPELLVTKELRVKFKEADDQGRMAMLYMFLSGGMVQISDKTVYIIGEIHGNA